MGYFRGGKAPASDGVLDELFNLKKIKELANLKIPLGIVNRKYHINRYYNIYKSIFSENLARYCNNILNNPNSPHYNAR